jgi:hypothetical protein
MNLEDLSGTNRQVLDRIFEEPTRADIDGDDFIRLYLALGGDMPKTGKTSGSRSRLRLNGVSAVLHRPHSGAIMKKGSVKTARDFLAKAGFTPRLK